MITIEKKRSIQEIKSYKKEWNDLLSESHGKLYYMDYDFVETEWENLGWEFEGKKILDAFVLFMRDNGKLVAIFPLLKYSRKFFRFHVTCFRPLTHFYYSKGDFILTGDAAKYLERAVQYLDEEEKGWNVFMVENVPEDSYLFKILSNRKCIFNKEIEAMEGFRSPYTKIEGSWEDYLRGRSKNFHKNLNHRMNRMKKKVGNYEIRCYESGDDLEKAIDYAFIVAEKSWMGKEGTSIGSGEERKKYWRTLTRKMGERGKVKIWILWIGEIPVAFEYQVVYNDVIYNNKKGYDLDFHEFSPGWILQKELTEKMWNGGYREMDFLGETDRFKEMWADRIRMHHNFYIFNNDIYSKIVFNCVFRLRRPVVKKIKKMMKRGV